ncbi:zinc ribbon domain-containing protein [Lentilactobacillus hilgardii]|uniref:zinc ribbon domain-containing protein n=1 Tax=Lentilactobacillus hilgardii TaxID=1588 RepID=UPI0039ECD2A9
MGETKFCMNCGKKIDRLANFCQYCGHPQAVPNDAGSSEISNGVKGSNKATSDTISTGQDVSDSSISKRASDVNPASFGNCLNLDNMNAYRKQLGFTGTDNICVYGYFFSTVATIALGALVGLASKYYIISFEHDGILLMGMGVTQHFNGKNSFVNFSDVSAIKFTSFGTNYHLTVESPKGEIKAKIVKMVLGHSWQAQNAKKLAKLYR